MSITYHNDGTISIRAEDAETGLTEFDVVDLDMAIETLRRAGFVVIPPVDVAALRYLNAECPVCHRKQEGK